MNMEPNLKEDGPAPKTTSPQLFAAQLYQTVAAVVLSVIPVMLLLFFLAPAVSVFGIDTENLYGLLSDETGFEGCAIAALTIACAATAFAIPLLLGVFYKNARPLVPPFLILETFLSLASLITAATMIGKIADMDDGLGLIEVGASPILALVFTALATLCGIIYLVIAFHPTLDPFGLAPHRKPSARP